MLTISSSKVIKATSNCRLVLERCNLTPGNPGYKTSLYDSDNRFLESGKFYSKNDPDALFLAIKNGFDILKKHEERFEKIDKEIKDEIRREL